MEKKDNLLLSTWVSTVWLTINIDYQLDKIYNPLGKRSLGMPGRDDLDKCD